MPGIMMTIGATAIAIRGTLKRRSTITATEPDEQSCKKRSRRKHHAQIIQHEPQSICSQGQKADRQHGAWRTVEQHCESAGRDETRNGAQQQLQRVNEFNWRLP